MGKNLVIQLAKSYILDLYFMLLKLGGEMGKTVAQRLERVEDRVRAAVEKSGRKREDVTVVGVTKTLPASLVLEGLRAGIRNFGENKLQATPEKKDEVKVEEPVFFKESIWHFIGHLQSNKAKKIVETFDVIQSIDSMKLVGRVDRLAGELNKPIDGLLQINVSGAETQGGIPFDGLDKFMSELPELSHLRLRGLMTIGPNTDDRERIQCAFVEMKKKFDQLREEYRGRFDFDMLSMGMSSDYDLAIEEGATVVRIGTAIFGPRHI